MKKCFFATFVALLLSVTCANAQSTDVTNKDFEVRVSSDSTYLIFRDPITGCEASGAQAGPGEKIMILFPYYSWRDEVFFKVTGSDCNTIRYTKKPEEVPCNQ